MVSPAFSSKNLELVSKVSIETADMLMERWERQLREEKTKAVDLNLEDFSELTMNVLFAAGFGIDSAPVFIDSVKKQKVLKESGDLQAKEFLNNMLVVWARALILRRFVDCDNSPILYSVILKWTGVGSALEFIGKTLDSIIENRKQELTSSTSTAECFMRVRKEEIC